MNKPKLAVIGSGISGITAAYLLQHKFDVSIFEKNDRLGGHTNTIQVKSNNEEIINIDTGFIVLNDCNYPVLHELFQKWGVKVRWSDMSFSYFNPDIPFYYAGTNIFGIFAQLSNLYSPEFYKFLLDIAKFCINANKFLNKSTSNNKLNPETVTLGEFLTKGNYSDNMIKYYLLPMGAAIWSAPFDKIKDFPAASFFNFFRNHGLLHFKNRPRWQTVCGGSSAYLEAFREKFSGEINLSSGISKVVRKENNIRITTSDNKELDFDKIVLACHADDSYKLLKDPSDTETELLSAWSYQNNEAILHTDSSVIAPSKKAWASWNYHENEESRSKGKNATLTYYMNLLQGITGNENYFVTLNNTSSIAEDKIIKRISYKHPVYNYASMQTQPNLHKLQGYKNTYYCGSYFGYGFHEDGARSGAQVALYEGINL